jgi:hypothetical protein
MLTVSKSAQAAADALLALAANSQLTKITEKPWHSATFAGQRVNLQILLKGQASKSQAKTFQQMLPGHEFSLPRHFVADIVIASIAATTDGTLMEIEMLVIEE